MLKNGRRKQGAVGADLWELDERDRNHSNSDKLGKAKYHTKL